MDLTRTRRLVVRMGDYEIFEFSATIRATHHDLGITDEELADDVAATRSRKGVTSRHDLLQQFVSEQLDMAIQTEIDDAAHLTTDRKSFIHKVKD